MNKIATFSKVSFEQFFEDMKKISFTNEEAVREIYDNIKLPKRGTVGSAGYDFFAPFEFYLNPKTYMLIPTGIRCNIQDDYVLVIAPRSSLGFKFRVQLDNTLGIIDSDYFFANNEGHIMIKLTNDTYENKICVVEPGKGFAQGIFLQYGITTDDDADGIRHGGFGSTNTSAETSKN